MSGRLARLAGRLPLSPERPSLGRPSLGRPSTERPSTERPSTERLSTERPSLGRRRYEAGKRATDIAVAAVALTAGAPLVAAIAWRIRREDGGPALYRGVRVGRYGRNFAMLKFRTMVVDAERLGGDSTPTDDPRLTRTGRWLRRHKLDELPQFVNVLRGEMSLVGPRPQVVRDVARYTEAERRLLDVRPGITDWSSIVFRDEGGILAGRGDADQAYDELIRPRKIELGLAYVERRGWRTDLRILWLTGLAVLGHPRIDELVRRAAPASRIHA